MVVEEWVPRTRWNCEKFQNEVNKKVSPKNPLISRDKSYAAADQNPPQPFLRLNPSVTHDKLIQEGQRPKNIYWLTRGEDGLMGRVSAVSWHVLVQIVWESE